MGKKVTIGKAWALLGKAHFGSSIRLEEERNEDCLSVFKAAAYYALLDEELEDILNTKDTVLRLFLLGVFVHNVG